MTADIATLRQLLAEGTPGPWEVPESIHGDPRITEVARGFLRGGGIAVADRRDDYGRANANLIAAAVNALPGLLDRVEAAEGAVERVRALAATWRSQDDTSEWGDHNKTFCARALEDTLRAALDATGHEGGE